MGNKKSVKCTEAVMKTCKYARYMCSNERYCDYISRTGHRRGCPPEECDKYEKKKKSKNITVSIK